MKYGPMELIFISLQLIYTPIAVPSCLPSHSPSFLHFFFERVVPGNHPPLLAHQVSIGLDASSSSEAKQGSAVVERLP